MSQEDVQLVRKAFLATSRGDPVGAQDTWDPSIELDMSGVTGWIEKPLYRGPEVAEFLRAWAGSWQDWHFDLEEVREGAGEIVFVAIHQWGIGTATGAPVDQRRYFAVAVRDGRIVRMRMFGERADAIEAAGVRA